MRNLFVRKSPLRRLSTLLPVRVVPKVSHRLWTNFTGQHQADEVAHWDLLEPAFDVRRINHSDAYSRDGVHTNLAESFFSRLRRMVGGQHHTVGRYLGAYAAPAAWLEDHRGESNGALADRLVGAALTSPGNRSWKGYWQ